MDNVIQWALKNEPSKEVKSNITYLSSILNMMCNLFDLPENPNHHSLKTERPKAKELLQD